MCVIQHWYKKLILKKIWQTDFYPLNTIEHLVNIRIQKKKEFQEKSFEFALYQKKSLEGGCLLT